MNTSSRGVVLLLVIVFGLILSIIGIAAIENAGQQQIVAANLLSEHRAQQIAYAGIQLGRNYLSGCRDAFSTIPYSGVEPNFYMFPEHVSANRNPIIVPIPAMFAQAIQNQGSLSVSITPDPGNTTQVLLPATQQNICKSLYGVYTISSTATITTGISGTVDVIKNVSIRITEQRTGTFCNPYSDTNPLYPEFFLTGARADFTMTETYLYPTYEILLAGGLCSGTGLKTAELFYLRPYQFLPNGDTNSVEVFKTTNGMNVARAEHTATQLGTGDVLVAGGTGSAGNILSSAETYNAPSSAFALTVNPMMAPRSYACAASLTDGNALIAGGYSTGGAPTSSAEVYTTATGKFNFTSPMALPRAGAAAVRLNDGSVLIVGGIQATGVYAPRAELYTYPAPSAPTMHGVFTLVGALAEPRYQPTATVLDDGTVLVCGGYTGNSHHPLTAEIYNPATHAFTPTTGAPIHSRFGATATLLYSGQVLITGGIIDGALGPIVTNTAELYDPLDKTFYPIVEDIGSVYCSSNMLSPRVGHQAMILDALIPGAGWVLIAGGNSGADYLKSAEIFLPILAIEQINNSYVEGPIVRKTHQ